MAANTSRLALAAAVAVFVALMFLIQYPSSPTGAATGPDPFELIYGNEAPDAGSEVAAIPGDCPAGMVSYWKAENDATDSFGSYNGVFAAGTYVAGKVGQAFDFDGSDDFVDLSSVPSQTYPLTIGMWVKPDSSSPVGIFDSAPHAGNTIRNYPSGNVDWHQNDPTYSLGLSAGTWTHIALIFTYDGNRHIDYYKNGVFQTSVSGSTNSALGWSNMRLGDINTGNDGRYAGTIDEVAIFDRVLGADEIEAMYLNGLSNKGYCEPDSDGDGLVDDLDACDNNIAPSDLASYWGFDEGSGSTAFDSYDGNDGTLHNMDDADWVLGQIGGALDFDGVNDYVHAGQDLISNADLADGGTISAWVNPDFIPPGDAVELIVSNERFDISVGYGSMSAYVSDGVSGIVLSGAPLTPGNWYHVVFTIDGIDNASLYINGVLHDSAPYSGNTNQDSVSRPCLFGDHFSTLGSSTHNFDGRIDAIAFFYRGMDATEIQQLYQNGLSNKGYCLVDCYHDADSDDFPNQTEIMVNDTCAGDWMDCGGMPAGLIFWNKMGSEAEVLNSEVGPDLVIQSPGGVGYAAVQFDDGVGTSGVNKYAVYIDSSDISTVLNAEAGTIETWYEQVQDPLEYQYGLYRIFNGPFGLNPAHDIMFWVGSPSYNNFLVKGDVKFGGASQASLEWDPGNDVRNNHAYNNVPIHLALVWDVNGIEGVGDTARLYVDGVVVDSDTAVFGTTVNPAYYGDIGSGQDGSYANKFWVDNMKIWNYAKTDFSDRFQEAPVPPGCEWDCDDLNPFVNPNATEICNLVDDDCNGSIDGGVGLAGCGAYYMDGDDDTYGNATDSLCLCDSSGPYNTTNDTDCNDSDGTINPVGVEAENGLDDDCDGFIDEGFALGVSPYAVTIGGAIYTPGDTFTGTQKVELRGDGKLLVEFDHDFDNSSIDFSEIRIVVTDTSIYVDMGDALLPGETKTLYLADNSFTDLCVEDADIASISAVSQNCDGANEYDFTDCLGNGPTTQAGITCTDLGDTIKVEGLVHSAIRGTLPPSVDEKSYAMGYYYVSAVPEMPIELPEPEPEPEPEEPEVKEPEPEPEVIEQLEALVGEEPYMPTMREKGFEFPELGFIEGTLLGLLVGFLIALALMKVKERL